jgi:hypothetical protein
MGIRLSQRIAETTSAKPFPAIMRTSGARRNIEAAVAKAMGKERFQSRPV